MEVVITSLDALIHRATMATLERPDPAALEAFCAVMSDAPNGAFIGTRVIASRVRSPHPAEALLALDVLDACMKRCGRQFHQEVDKFRFLNELIKLVSPKYSGNKTAPAVRQKVLNLMQSWTVDYPSEIKIRDAYEMLKKQGVVKKTTPAPAAEEPVHPAVKPRTKDAIFEDEEKSRMLQKLLQSKNPEDLLAANRLIKTMVREDERRVEAVSRRITDLQAVHNNTRLLDEMLDQYRPGVSSNEELELIKELHAACSRLRPTIYKLAAETQQHEEILNEILDANDELGQVFDKYTTIILQGKMIESVLKTTSARTTSGSVSLNGEGNSLLDLATGSTESSKSMAKQESSVNSNLDELGDIFSSVNASRSHQSTVQIKDIPVLQPINLTSSTSEKEASNSSDKDTGVVSRGLAELDALGEDLLKQSLPLSSKLGGSQFNHKPTPKVPMNSLIKSPSEDVVSDLNNQSCSSERSSAMPHNSLLDLDFLISKTLKSETDREPQAESCLNDDAILDIALDESLDETNARSLNEDISLFEYLEELKMEDRPQTKNFQKNDEVNDGVNTKQPTMQNNNKASEVASVNSNSKETAVSPLKMNEVKPLTDINISLASIKPGSHPPLSVFQEQDGLAVVLHFAENKPRPDVFVIVISTTSKHSQPIEEFKFHAVVPKGCKVRLLPASGDSFPTFSPFLPPAAITQVMLVGRPVQEPPLEVYLKFVITYTCQDDTISEMGEVNCLPLDN